MTDKILSILQHAIGANQYGQGGGYRNHFVTGAGSFDHPHCVTAVELGFMTIAPMRKELTGGDDCFTVTAAGKIYVAKHSPPAPPPRERTAWDRYHECTVDETFAEYLNINKPKVEYSGSVWGTREYRMFREKWCGYMGYHVRDVVGEWSPTRAGAKASYKAALKKLNDTRRAARAAKATT